MGDEVRPFPTRITGWDVNAAVERELGKVPPDRTVAFIATATKEGDTNARFRMAVMLRQGNTGWSFAGFLDKEMTGPLTAGAQLRYSK